MRIVTDSATLQTPIANPGRSSSVDGPLIPSRPGCQRVVIHPYRRNVINGVIVRITNRMSVDGPERIGNRHLHYGLDVIYLQEDRPFINSSCGANDYFLATDDIGICRVVFVGTVLAAVPIIPASDVKTIGIFRDQTASSGVENVSAIPFFSVRTCVGT